MSIVIELPNSVRRTIESLENAGFEAYVVGGCVRDSIMGKVPNDWDVTTNAEPNQVKTCTGQRTIDTGIKHGTVSIIYRDMHVEVTSYRVDGTYSDNRRPDSIAFTSDLREDLKRRDFTVNAMAYNPGVGLVDCFGGLKDIENAVIKCVGDPSDRFAEDALRIMRAYRFASTLNFKIDDDTLKAITEKMHLLARISVERITSEFNKILTSKEAGKYLKAMLEMGAFRYVISEFEDTRGFDQHNPGHDKTLDDHILCAVDCVPNDLILRLTMLLHDIAKPTCFVINEKGIGSSPGHAKRSAEMADDILRRLKYDKHTSSAVRELVLYHATHITPDAMGVKGILRHVGEERFRQLLAVQRADIMAQNPLYINRLDELDRIESVFLRVLEEGQCFCLKDLKINGSDLKDMGFEGRQIGKSLDLILDMVIEGSVDNERKMLMKTAGRILEEGLV